MRLTLLSRAISTIAFAACPCATSFTWLLVLSPAAFNFLTAAATIFFASSTLSSRKTLERPPSCSMKCTTITSASNFLATSIAVDSVLFEWGDPSTATRMWLNISGPPPSNRSIGRSLPPLCALELSLRPTDRRGSTTSGLVWRSHINGLQQWSSTTLRGPTCSVYWPHSLPFGNLTRHRRHHAAIIRGE